MKTRLSPTEVEQARQRRLGAMRSQEIEGNPLSPEDVAMFEMFEREAWPHHRRLSYILAVVVPNQDRALLTSTLKTG